MSTSTREPAARAADRLPGRFCGWTAADLVSGPVVTVTEGESVVVAALRMHTEGVHHLPVLRGDDVVGMVDEFALAQYASGRTGVDLRTTVRSVMRAEVVRVQPWTPLETVARQLIYSPSAAVVVVDHRRLVGVVTATDVLAAVATAAGGPPAPSSDDLP